MAVPSDEASPAETPDVPAVPCQSCPCPKSRSQRRRARRTLCRPIMVEAEAFGSSDKFLDQVAGEPVCDAKQDTELPDLVDSDDEEMDAAE